MASKNEVVDALADGLEELGHSKGAQAREDAKLLVESLLCLDDIGIDDDDGDDGEDEGEDYE